MANFAGAPHGRHSHSSREPEREEAWFSMSRYGQRTCLGLGLARARARGRARGRGRGRGGVRLGLGFGVVQHVQVRAEDVPLAAR